MVGGGWKQRELLDDCDDSWRMGGSCIGWLGGVMVFAYPLLVYRCFGSGLKVGIFCCLLIHIIASCARGPMAFFVFFITCRLGLLDYSGQTYGCCVLFVRIAVIFSGAGYSSRPRERRGLERDMIDTQLFSSRSGKWGIFFRLRCFSLSALFMATPYGQIPPHEFQASPATNPPEVRTGGGEPREKPNRTPPARLVTLASLVPSAASTRTFLFFFFFPFFLLFSFLRLYAHDYGETKFTPPRRSSVVYGGARLATSYTLPGAVRRLVRLSRRRTSAAGSASCQGAAVLACGSRRGAFRVVLRDGSLSGGEAPGPASVRLGLGGRRQGCWCGGSGECGCLLELAGWNGEKSGSGKWAKAGGFGSFGNHCLLFRRL